MLELLGFILLGLAVATYASAVWLFAVKGRGSPLPFAPPAEFVAQGPYRYTRNPMALAVVGAVAGASLAFSAPLGLLLAGVTSLVLHRYIVTREEPELLERFGSSYESYCQRVPRWLPWVGA